MPSRTNSISFQPTVCKTEQHWITNVATTLWQAAKKPTATLLHFPPRARTAEALAVDAGHELAVVDPSRVSSRAESHKSASLVGLRCGRGPHNNL